MAKTKTKEIVPGIKFDQRSRGEREITVIKSTVRETLIIDHNLVEKIVYDYLNMKGLINDCDKFSLTPNMSYELFDDNYTLYLERIIEQGSEERITDVAD